MFENIHFIDLTHNLHDKVPSWTGSCGFKHDVKKTHEEGGVLVMKYSLHGGIGTHVDAPVHFIKNGATIAQMALEHFFCPCVIIDVHLRRSEDLMIDVKDLMDYEDRYKKIKKNSLVIGFTGWQDFFYDPVKYRNEDSQGKMRFPGFTKQAAEFLLERDIAGIAIDTLSPDGSSTDVFPVHETLLGAGKYIIENAAHLEKMPPSGGYVVALPPKISVGAEAIIRLVGLVEKK